MLRLERRITRDGMVSVDGNLYSVPDTTRRRMVEVHSTADEVRILARHGSTPPPANSQTARQVSPSARTGDVVALRPLAFYDAVGKRLAGNGTQGGAAA